MIENIFSRYKASSYTVIIKLEPEVKAIRALGESLTISKFFCFGQEKWIAALELLVLSVPQGHTIPSGAIVITQKKFKTLYVNFVFYHGLKMGLKVILGFG